VTVRRHSYWIEVEIRADILFPSGVATISPSAVPALEALSKRSRRIRTRSRRRAHRQRPDQDRGISVQLGTVVGASRDRGHLLANGGVAAESAVSHRARRMASHQTNDTVEGRNANRRVLLVILSGAADSPTTTRSRCQTSIATNRAATSRPRGIRRTRAGQRPADRRRVERPGSNLPTGVTPAQTS
jgi:hypothetical protein